MRPPPLLGAALALAIGLGVLLPSASYAEVLPGELAPDVESRSSRGAPGPTAVSLRGAFTLLAFFRTACPHCQRDVPLLNAWATRHGPAGLRVLAVAYEPEADVDRFVQRHGLAVPIVYAGVAAVRDYAVPTLPRCYLVDPAGRVTWAGPPTGLQETALVRILASAPRIPTRPADLAWVDPLLEEERYGLLEERLTAALAEGDLGSEGTKAAEGLLAWVRWYVPTSLASAEGDALEGRSHEAWRTFRHLAAAFPGTAVGESALRQAEALLRDGAARADVEAGEALASARAKARGLKPSEALPLFREVVQKHRASRAADRARAFLADLEAEVRTRAGGR